MVQVCGGDVTCLEAQRWERCFDLRTFGLQKHLVSSGDTSIH